jgi:chromosome segregation ATPase
MDKKNDDINIIEMLREKTEDADLAHVLKGTVGGYTKKSVQEYLSILHKQQQTSKETFSRNLQTLFNEKESIRKNNETLLARLNKVEAEYDNLYESIKNLEIDDTEFTAQDFLNLKSNFVTLEEQLKKTTGDKNSLERKINQLNNEIDDLNKRLIQSNIETEAQKEMLKTERSESNKQRSMVADLSRLLEEEKNEVKYLKATITEGKLNKLNSKINKLTEQLSSQTEVIEKYYAENQLKEEYILTLNSEIDILKKRTNSLFNTIDELNARNDKLLLTNKNLSTKLEEEYKKSIELINEKSGITIDKLIAQSKLSDALSQISLLELKSEKHKRLSDAGIVGEEALSQHEEDKIDNEVETEIN